MIIVPLTVALTDASKMSDCMICQIFRLKQFENWNLVALRCPYRNFHISAQPGERTLKNIEGESVSSSPEKHLS